MSEIEELLEPEDDRISAIFRHFEALTSLTSGRTVGRKIGIVQEIILKKYLEAEEILRRRMYIEQLLDGRSGASHKVEFSCFPIESHEVRVAVWGVKMERNRNEERAPLQLVWEESV